MPDEPGGPMLSMEIEPTPQAPSIARAAITGFCEGRGMSTAALATTALLVSEVVTNAVIHPQVASSAIIRLCARVRQDVLRVAVIDEGRGFTPTSRDPGRPTGGYGLFLLEKEAARWGVEQTPRAKVWFEVDIGRIARRSDFATRRHTSAATGVSESS